jgi:glycosyltransferase involved in cell wall biosynthesis
MQTIKVLCVTSHSDRPETETFIGLRELGIDVRVLCAPRARHYERLHAAGVPVAPLELTARFDRPAIAEIRRRIDADGIAILHLFNNKAVLNGLIAAKRRSVKIVAYRGIVGNVSYLDPLSWMRYLNPRIDRIVCVAEAIRRHLLDLHLLGLRIPPRKVVTIYKGHDLTWYRDTPADLHPLGVPEGAFTLGCVANYRPRKGVEVLIDAMSLLPEDAPIHVLLIGDMQSRRLLAKIAASRSVSRVHVLGYRNDAPAVVAACDAAVLPSLSREGLPKTVIEAMAYGVPPIVTNVGGSPELVAHEQSGLVVPPGDAPALARAIERLWKDPALAKTYGRAARHRIETHFSIEETVRQTAQLYRDVLEEP